MRTSTIVWIIVAIIIIGGGVWYYTSMQTPAAPATTTTQTTTDTTGTAAVPAVAIASNSSLGNILTTQSGMTLYTYSPDTAGLSNCSGQCAVNWPPLTIATGVNVGAVAGASGSWGTFTRSDGTIQVTYNGAPLYTYIKDTQPGDTVGQGVGGVWYVAKP